jgi:hypothetical protein
VPSPAEAEEKVTMNENTTWRIRFCDEYEALWGEFLKIVAAWTQFHGLFSRQTEAEGTIADIELARIDYQYATALWALLAHTRRCVICKETLRVQVNGGERATERATGIHVS